MSFLAIFLILFSSVIFGLVFENYFDMSGENSQKYKNIGEKSTQNKESYRESHKSAYVLGYTGEVGKVLVRQLLEDKIFSKVVLIGRRKVEYTDSLLSDAEQVTVDFDNLDKHADVFKGINVGFCCLGTTRGKSGADGFYKVDHDYVLNAAKLSKDSGVEHFHLVSSKGADINSSILYTKTKGEIEKHVADLEFDRLSIYRPGALLCNREESRPMEAVFRFMLKPVSIISPTLLTTPVTTVAKAMINNNVAEKSENTTIFTIKDIFYLAGEKK